MSGVVTITNRMVVDCAGQHRSLPLPILRLKSGVADESGERVITAPSPLPPPEDRSRDETHSRSKAPPCVR